MKEVIYPTQISASKDKAKSTLKRDKFPHDNPEAEHLPADIEPW